jgi:hypothetical protein
MHVDAEPRITEKVKRLQYLVVLFLYRRYGSSLSNQHFVIVQLGHVAVEKLPYIRKLSSSNTLLGTYCLRVGYPCFPQHFLILR